MTIYIVHEVLMTSVLGWFAVLSSSGSRFVRTLCCDPSSWVTLHNMAHSFIELLKPLGNDKAVILGGGSDAN